jgi:SAM-dependent methyltransferase
LDDDPIQTHNKQPAASWGSAGRSYEKFSEDLGDAIVHCVRRLAPRSWECVLDVATGTGWGARLLAARGATVHGIDFAPELIEAAQTLATKSGIEIKFSVANAESLPFEDASFDVVMSTFGVIFVLNPEAAATEMARVCRPGGRIGLTAWPPDGTIAALVKEVMLPYRSLSPPQRPPSQFQWGTRECVVELLGESFDLLFENGCTVLREPSGEDVWRMWSKSHGLTVTTLKGLSPQRRKRFRRDFIAFHEKFRTELGITMPRDYLVTIGERK